jgi:hypothetical protein
MIKASCTCSKPNDSLSRRLPLLWMPLSAVLASFFGIGLSVFDPAECAADRDDVFEDATASFDSSDGGLVGTLNDVRAAAKDSEYGNRGILKAPPSSVAPPIGGLTAISSIRQGVLPLDFISRRGPPKNSHNCPRPRCPSLVSRLRHLREDCGPVSGCLRAPSTLLPGKAQRRHR